MIRKCEGCATVETGQILQKRSRGVSRRGRGVIRMYAGCERV